MPFWFIKVNINIKTRGSLSRTQQQIFKLLDRAGARAFFGGKQYMTGAHYGGKTLFHTSHGKPRNLQRLSSSPVGCYGM